MQFGLRTLLFVVLLLGMLVLSYPLLFKPLEEQRNNAREETRVKQQRLDALAAVMQRTRSMPEEIDKLQKAIRILTDKLPAETDMDKVLQEIWKAAKDNDLIVKSVRNAKPIIGANYSEQPIKMVIEGPFYPGFFKFLSQVEQLPRLTKIPEMMLEADPKNNGAVSAELTLSIYYESTQKVAVAQ